MLKSLEKSLISEQKNADIFDVIVYGSALKGKIVPDDIDIVIIFLRGSLKERLDILQKIKRKIKLDSADLKQMLLKDLFSSSFLARTGILLEGWSLFKKRKFSEVLGFKAYTLFWYTLEGLSHSEKVKFNYILAGRNSEGVMAEMKGERLANGAVKIPIENSLAFEEIIKNNKINYKKKNILEEI